MGSDSVADPITSRDDMLQRLARFGAWALRKWHADGERGDLDGGVIQDAAEYFGVVHCRPVPAEGCGDDCVCISNGAEEGDLCYPIDDHIWQWINSAESEPGGQRLTPPPKSAPEILEMAAGCIRQRAAVRDLPAERSMARTVVAFNALTGHHLTERDGWLFMVILKAARATAGAHNADDYTDGAAYFALAGENAGPTNTEIDP